MFRHFFLYVAIRADSPFPKEGQSEDQPYCEGKKGLRNPVMIWDIVTHHTFLKKKKKEKQKGKK